MYRTGDILARTISEIVAGADFADILFNALRLPICPDHVDLFTQLVDSCFIGDKLALLLCNKRTFSPPEFCDATRAGQSPWRR